MSPNEELCLVVLANRARWDENYLSFAAIADYSGIEAKKIRRTVRALARKGYAEFGRGLFNEDGGLAGAGYCSTHAGCEVAERLIADQKKAMRTKLPKVFEWEGV